jgi:hypothetical protein
MSNMEMNGYDEKKGSKKVEWERSGLADAPILTTLS